MLSKTQIALFAAIALGTAFPASAATKHRGVAPARRDIYDVVSAPGGGDCSPVHPPLCSNICTGAGPCAAPDGW